MQQSRYCCELFHDSDSRVDSCNVRDAITILLYIVSLFRFPGTVVVPSLFDFASCQMVIRSTRSAAEVSLYMEKSFMISERNYGLRDHPALLHLS